MIMRIFTVQVAGPLQAEFEEKFSTVSVPYIRSKSGLIDVEIGRPLAGDDYVMISFWQDKAALEAAFGAKWAEPSIPSGMEKFADRCTVSHHESF